MQTHNTLLWWLNLIQNNKANSSSLGKMFIKIIQLIIIILKKDYLFRGPTWYLYYQLILILYFCVGFVSFDNLIFKVFLFFMFLFF